jgi:hypothetical protein
MTVIVPLTKDRRIVEPLADGAGVRSQNLGLVFSR